MHRGLLHPQSAEAFLTCCWNPAARSPPRRPLARSLIMTRYLARAALAGLLAVAILPAAFVSPVFAHAHLRSAAPAADSTVATPSEVVCHFTEALEPRYSALEVQDAGGHRVDSGNMHLAAGDPKQMLVGLPRLGPGVYTVIWHATSIDTHKTEGRFSFTVQP
jgi:methionine-rich copper-binding protein CopC